MNNHLFHIEIFGSAEAVLAKECQGPWPILHFKYPARMVSEAIRQRPSSTRRPRYLTLHSPWQSQHLWLIPFYLTLLKGTDEIFVYTQNISAGQTQS